MNPTSNPALACVLDPFHDTTLNVRGWPDGEVAQSFVRHVSLTKSIVCPFDIPENQQWNVHFFSTPLPYLTNLSLNSIANLGGNSFPYYDTMIRYYI